MRAYFWMLAPTLTLLVLVLTQLSFACACEVAATAWVCHWLDQWQPMLVQLSLTRKKVRPVPALGGVIRTSWVEC